MKSNGPSCVPDKLPVLTQSPKSSLIFDSVFLLWRKLCMRWSNFSRISGQNLFTVVAKQRSGVDHCKHHNAKVKTRTKTRTAELHETVSTLLTGQHYAGNRISEQNRNDKKTSATRYQSTPNTCVKYSPTVVMLRHLNSTCLLVNSDAQSGAKAQAKLNKIYAFRQLFGFYY